jgi:hypothetical protein
VIDLGGACRRHRPALLDFVAGGEAGPTTPAALAHLDRCDRCLAELESTSLTIAALRRLGTELADVEPPADAWPRLRTKVVRWRAPRFPIMSPVAGMAMSLAIVVATVLGGPGLPGSAPESPGFAQPGPAETIGPVEEAWLRERIDPSRRPSPPATIVPIVPVRTDTWMGPDGMGAPIVVAGPRNALL